MSPVKDDAKGNDDPFELHRFLDAQEGIYERALAELQSGKKRTHWMWFVFPQIIGLGTSPTSLLFAIKSRAEARAYLDHPVLGARLMECATILLSLQKQPVTEIFDYPDDLKLRSSMTLFACVAGPDSDFLRILEKYFDGEGDDRTVEILEKLEE